MRVGEWTTYGDIAAAVGKPGAARAVGREAATSESFPNPHRVLKGDGTISRGGRRQRGRSIERARRLLEQEGIAFSPSGRADPAARIYWDELKRRAGQVAVR